MTLADDFAARHGRAPDGVWSAPGRVNLIGEHTDYNGGFVLPFAIDRRTTCAAGLNADGVLRATSASLPGVFEVALGDLDAAEFQGWSGYALGVAWALQRRGHSLAGLPGVDLHLGSDVPIGAGLSSSAAMESAVAVALSDLWGLGLDRMELAQAGRLAENGAVGAPTGIMDQVASLLGVEDHAVLLDCASLEAVPVPLRLAEQGLAVLVLDSRVAHRHADGGYASRRAACESVASVLGVELLCEASIEQLEAARARLDDVIYRRARHVLTESRRVLDAVAVLRGSGPRALGPLLAASHASMRDDFEISVPEIDLIVDTAVSAGAIGARLTGGGFGGSAIAVVDADRADDISDAVKAASTSAGFAEPNVLVVRASRGAGRDAEVATHAGGTP